MWHRWFAAGTIAVFIAIALASMRFIAAPAFVGAPDTVHIVVTDIQPPSSNQTVIFDHQFTHQARTIYQQLVAGGQIPSTALLMCPPMSNRQPYYHYELTFFHMGVKVATATSDAAGCANITVEYLDSSTDNYFWETSSHISFWIQLHQLVNAPEPVNTCIGIDIAAKKCITIPAS